MSRILFVCTDNTCRSAMAQAIFMHTYSAATKTLATSAGIHPHVDEAANPLAVAVLEDQDIPLTGHRARQITKDMYDEADFVVVMTKGHAMALRVMFPDAEFVQKVCLIKGFGPEGGVGGDLMDPFGGNIEDYRFVRDQISVALEELKQFLVKTQE